MLGLAIKAAAAVGGYLLADSLIQRHTGKHIHQHLFDWWCELRDYLCQWLHQNSHLGICRVGITVLDRFDDVAVRTKKMADLITLGVFAMDTQKNVYDVACQEVSGEEAMAQFPELRDNPVLVEELAH